MHIDLHCHSIVSDGLLAPAEVVARGAGNGVKALALTDHDDLGGLEEARSAARDLGVFFVNGVEISVTWNSQTLHIVGLRVDASNPYLKQGVESVRSGRAIRAQRIAAKLEESGIAGALQGANAYVTNPALIGRMHFARFLVERGYAKDANGVFKRYLAKGKPGYVPHQWAALGDAVSWIRASGGVPVIAHPGRYPFGPENLRKLFAEFRELGGQALEVVSSSHTPEQFRTFAAYAAEYGLLASAGSDFHGPKESWMDIGRVPDLPRGCVPVWRDWDGMPC